MIALLKFLMKNKVRKEMKMSKWKNVQTGDTFDSRGEAFDDIFDNISPSDVIYHIIETAEEKDLVAALDGKTPDFYTYNLMGFAEKQCDKYIVEIPDEEEEDTEEN